VSRISDDDINAIRKRADLVEIIQRYLPVIKKGKNFSAVCPFHDDHDPSLSIAPDKQIYKCFVCGAGGNVFTFIRDYEKITFAEAVIKVADFVNYPLAASVITQQPTISLEHQRLHALLQEMINYTQYALKSADTVGAKAYLNQRGIDDERIKRFEIGLNPDKNQTSSFLMAKGFTLQECVSANVTRVSDNGPSDVFFNRILFPIHDPQGHPVGFTARTLNPNESSKYINSSETPVYVKGKLLYNYHRALSAAKRQKQLILVEGVTDVIAFDRAEITHVVATLGTACTTQQIRLIQQASTRVLLCYDGDNAGQTAAYKIGKLLTTFKLNVEVVLNTTGMDPDDIARSRGPLTLKTLIETKTSYADFVFSYLKSRFDFSNYTQKKEFASLVLKELDGMGDAFDQAALVHRLSEQTGFASEQLALLRDKKVPIVTTTARPILEANTPSSLRSWAEFEILGMMLRSLRAAVEYKDQLGFLNEPMHDQCALLILDYYRKNDKIEVADLINSIEDTTLVQLITDLSENEVYYKEYREKALQDAMIRVKINRLDQTIDLLKQQIKQELSLSEHQRLLTQLTQLQRERRTLVQMTQGG
jgi:DNA primase